MSGGEAIDAAEEVVRAEWDQFCRAWNDAASSGRYRYWDSRRQRWTRHLPIPRRARLRIWRHKHLTTAGCWLIDHGHEDLAERLWRACRMM